MIRKLTNQRWRVLRLIDSACSCSCFVLFVYVRDLEVQRDEADSRVIGAYFCAIENQHRAL
jgi:hypothetical protein